MNKVRRKNRVKTRTENRPNYSSSASIASLLESGSQSVANSSQFPMVLPQSSVTLEFGVIDVEHVARPEPDNADQEQDVHQLIEVCRRWRELSRKSRNKFKSNSNFVD